MNGLTVGLVELDCADAPHETDPTPREHIEEYLEVLVISEEKGNRSVKTSWIAKRLNVAQPSVVQMLRKLERSGFVSFAPRKGVELAASGRKVGREILRNHRLFETFIMKNVGVEVEEKIACGIEHHLSPELADAICTTMDHPRKCIHGYSIPLGKCCTSK